MTYAGQSAAAPTQGEPTSGDPTPDGGKASLRDVVAAYVGLTKPRVIELLLLTTVPVMFFAARGVPPLGLVVATVIGGTLSAGSASTLNCVYDRDIDEQMRRTRRRALPRHIVSSRNALVFGLVLGVISTVVLARLGQLALGDAGGAGQRVLRARLHDGAQAPDHAEHRLGRPGRLLPGAHRLDGGDRRARVGAGDPVHGRLLLDAAAHLGAGAALPRGLRGRRRADAAGGRPGRRGGQADRPLLLRHGGHLAAAVAGRRHRVVLPRGRRWSWAWSSSSRRTACGAGPRPATRSR